jgi:hypothetical protein
MRRRFCIVATLMIVAADLLCTTVIMTAFLSKVPVAAGQVGMQESSSIKAGVAASSSRSFRAIE